MTEATPSLREKFEKACLHPSMWKEHNRMLEKGHTGTEQDFYNRFDEIANGLKANLEALIEEIDNCKSVISSAGDAYKHFGEPLKYEIVFPKGMSDALKRSIEDEGLYSIPGYQKIHEVCSSKEIDMDVRVALHGSGYHTSTGKSVGYDGIAIEIDPTRPYKLKSNRSRPGPAPAL